VGDTKFVMAILLIFAWAFWMPGEVLIFHYNLGIVWCWIWMAVYIAVLGIIFMVRWHNEKWKDIQLIQH
jgi:Na+-driven multidrug efflux pump